MNTSSLRAAAGPTRQTIQFRPKASVDVEGVRAHKQLEKKRVQNPVGLLSVANMSTIPTLIQKTIESKKSYVKSRQDVK